jgi:hypothetical protein
MGSVPPPAYVPSLPPDPTRYEKQLQWVSFAIGLAVAGGFNLDTIALTTHLYGDKEAREAAVEIAARVTDATDREAFDRCLALDPAERKTEGACAQLMGLVDAVQSRNRTLGKLPIGWGDGAAASPHEPTFSPLRILGWVLTALALSLGAPFWFDLLNRLISVRHGMRKPDPKPSGSKT